MNVYIKKKIRTPTAFLNKTHSYSCKLLEECCLPFWNCLYSLCYLLFVVLFFPNVGF